VTDLELAALDKNESLSQRTLNLAPFWFFKKIHGQALIPSLHFPMTPHTASIGRMNPAAWVRFLAEILCVSLQLFCGVK
jgi:hypothetical protein